MSRARAVFRAGSPMRVREGDFEVDTDPGRIDVDMVHGFLTNCYWSPGIPREVVERAIEASLCFGVYDLSAAGAPLIAFARAITDAATFAYLADVFVLESHRGRGVSRLLMRSIMAHPDLQGLRRWMLLTRDAHGLYRQFGFAPMAKPDRAMERHDPDVYLRNTPPA